MQWASAISEAETLDSAIEEVRGAVSEQLGDERPDLLLTFVSSDFDGEYDRVPEGLLEGFPGAALVGCSAGGVVGGGHEVERRRALSLTAAQLPGVELVPFHLGAGEAEVLLDDPTLWYRTLELEPDDDPQFVLLPDPFTSDAEALVRSLDLAFPAAGKVGGLASGGRGPGDNALFLLDEAHPFGAVGVAVHGDVTVETIVAQGCRPIGSPLWVTAARDNRILELDGRKPTDVMAELYHELEPEDQQLFRNALFVGIVMEEGLEEYGHGDFLIRNLVGVDADSGAIAVGAPMTRGQVVQFHLRDARTSAEDLDALLRDYREGRDGGGRTAPEGALLFSCMGRGERLYGEPDHDSRRIAEILGPLPVGGFFCNGEIGPVHGRSFLHGYTSAIGLFRPK